MTYIAIDPGSARTGWAVFDDKGAVQDMGIIKGMDPFLDWLEEEAPKHKVAIIENYRNRGGFTNDMSSMPTSQMIGAITRILRKASVAIVLQEPSPCLSIGLRFLKLYDAYKGKHVPDNVSALAHGTYYLRKEGIIK